jgi:thioredoxin-like negative regulator of GroEL
MMTSDFIIDVNESDFEYEVIAHSHQTPVVVDFGRNGAGRVDARPNARRLAHEAQGNSAWRG